MYCQVASSLFPVGFEMAPFQNLVFAHPKSAFASQALEQYVNGNMIIHNVKNTELKIVSLLFMPCLPLTLFLLFCCMGMRLFFLEFIVSYGGRCVQFINQYMIN